MNYDAKKERLEKEDKVGYKDQNEPSRGNRDTKYRPSSLIQSVH